MMTPIRDLLAAVAPHSDGHGRAARTRSNLNHGGSAWIVLSAACIFALAGCGPNGFARDALVENPGAEAFLNRIQQNCGKLSVGNQPLNWLLSTSSNDVTFVDLTSKLYLGQFSPKDYTDGINSFYPTGTNAAALDCIFKQR